MSVEGMVSSTSALFFSIELLEERVVDNRMTRWIMVRSHRREHNSLGKGCKLNILVSNVHAHASRLEKMLR